MNTSPFDKFMELVAFDQSINVERNKLHALDKEIASFCESKERAFELFNTLKDHYHEAQKAVDAQELIMQEYDQRADECKKKIELVSSKKEYEALKKEVDTIRQNQHDLEGILVDVWNTLETVKREYAAHQEKSSSQLEAIDTVITEKKAIKKKLEQEIESLMSNREVKKEGIPEEWLIKYATMRSSVQDPVVTVTAHSCSACFYPVSREDMLRLKKNALLQCKSCYRFLRLQFEAE